jgi:radical SAM protein with 4Fe4S-binding SPASM domain
MPPSRKTRRKPPTDAVVAVTYRCNLRCGKCNLWRHCDSTDLDPTIIDKLPTSLLDLNISGGEPFLHPQLTVIVHRALEHLPKTRIIISTGGWLTGEQVDVLHALSSEHDRVGLAISLDGLAVEHDLERGRPGSYQMALDTLERARKFGYDDLRIAFTITPQNVALLPKMQELARKLAVEMSVALVHASEHYFVPAQEKQQVDKKVLEKAVAKVLEEQAQSLSPKELARAYFLAGLDCFNRTGKRPLPCYAGGDFFFLDPNGLVYACNMLAKSLGDLSRQSFDQIWNGKAAREAFANAEACNSCWMVCSARSAIKRHKARVAAWVLRAKLGNPRME